MKNDGGITNNGLIFLFPFFVLLSSYLLTDKIMAFYYYGNATFTTTIVVYGFIWSVLGLVTVVFVSGLDRWRWLMTITSILGTLFIFEVFLYSNNYYLTYSEKNYGQYHSLYHAGSWEHNVLRTGRKMPSRQYRTYAAADTGSYGKEPLNKLGYRGPTPPPNKRPLIIVGDSFTEGVGTHKDATLPRFVESHLNDRGCTTAVFNAGISGSDPFFDFHRVKNVSDTIPPEAVLFTVNSSDIEDVAIRGGKGRFKPNAVQYKEPPDFEFIYAASFVARVVINNIWTLSHTLRTRQQKRINSTNAVNKIEQFFRKTVSPYYEKRNILYYIMLVPTKHDLKGGKIVNQHYRMLEKKLTRAYPDRFYDSSEFLLKNYNNNTDKLYWPIDQHSKPKGYRILGQAAATFLAERDGLCSGQ